LIRCGLAVLHHANTERRALIRNDRRKHELDRRILEHHTFVGHDLRLGILLRELGEQFRFFDVYARELAAAACHGVDHTIDMRMVDSDDAEAEACCVG
jgi:hypothetical protein